MSIFDEITEQEWKAPRKTIFDDITPEEINPQPVEKPSWVQNLSAMGGDDPSFYTPSEQTVRPGQLTEGMKDVARTGLKGVSALYEFAGGDSAIKRGLSMVPGLKGASALMQASSKPVVKVAEEISSKPELQPDPSMAPKNWGEQFIRTVPQVGTQIVASIAYPALGGATIASQIAGGTYEDLISKGVPKDKAAIWGLANAAMQAPLEQLGINKALKYFKVKGKIVDLLKSAGTEFVTEWAQSYPDAFVNIFAPDPDKSLLDKTKEYLEKLPETTKQGMYEGSLTAPFAILPSAVNLATKGEVESEAPGLTSDQILAGLNNKTISAEQANAIKQAKPEYADIVDQALSEFQSTDTEKAKREFVDPVKVARERNQSIMDSVDLDVLAEADQTVERQQAKKQEAGIAEEAAIADRTTAKRRFKALSEIWDTLSDGEQDKAIELILPKTEPPSVTAERQQKAEAQTFERTGVPSSKRAQDAETILAGLKRFNIKLSPDEQARLESEAGKKQDQDLEKVGVWTEPTDLAQELTAPVPPMAEPAPSQAPPTQETPVIKESLTTEPTVKESLTVDIPQPQVATEAVKSFKTAKGSAYAVNPDGTTTRDKAPRPEHPGEQGAQPKSKKTWYVEYDDLNKLDLVQTNGGIGKIGIGELPDGRIAAKYITGPSKGKFIKDTIVSPKSAPEVGLVPVESWGDTYTVHFGNKITEVEYQDDIGDGKIPANESKPAKGENQKPINDLGKSGRRQLAGAYGEVGEVDSRTVDEREAQGERRRPKIETKKLKDILGNEKGSDTEPEGAATVKKASVEFKRSRVTKNDILKAFDKIVSETPDGYIVELPNGKQVHIDTGKKRIDVDIEAVKEAWDIEGNVMVSGAFSQANGVGLIELLETTGPDVLSHEKFHALFSMVFDGNQKSKILKRYGSEEKAAEAFRRSEGFTRSFWEKIKAFLDKLRSVFFGDYFRIGESVSTKETNSKKASIQKQESIDDLIAKLQKAEPKKEVVQHESGDGWYDKISAFERPINDLTAWLADKNHPISVIQRRLKSVRENIDVFLRETQRPKVTAAKIEKMWTDEVEPLLEDMANSNITLPDLEEYAHAIHAPEANEKLSDAMAKTYLDNILNVLPKNQTIGLRSEISQLKNKRKESGLAPKDYRSFLDRAFKIYPDERVKGLEEQYNDFIKKPSGMTDADALAIQKKWKGNQDIERLRQRLKGINSNRLDILYDAGLVADEEYNAMKAKYKEYVPLRREGYDETLFGPSRGLRPSGRPIKTRMGSNRNVVNILAHSIANYEKAINLAEKARSTEALKNLVLENPDPELWTLKKEKKSPRHDNYGNVRMYPDLFNVANNEMRFMVGGKQWILEVNKDNKDAMNMLKTLKAEDSIHGWALNQLARLNRILARVNTSWSPEFVISNFARDLQTAGINIKDTGVKSKSMISGALKAAKSIWRVERGKQKGTEYEKLYERFKIAGGKIGWADVHSSIENLSKKLTKEIETLAGKRPTRRLIKQIGDFVEAGNTSIENGVRLHAFKLAVEQGFSDAKAAQIASDLTVDFTKKGYAGPAINSLYLFANAGIQGSYRIIRAATKSARVRRTMAAIFGMGILNGFLNSMAGDDEDGEDYFNKIEDYLKERNAIFMLPGTKGKYVKIPLPWGYNLPWATGVEFSRVFTQRNYKPMEGAMRVGSTFVNAFNPIQSGTLMQTLAPTVADPFVMVAENKNWFGGPLMPDQNQFDKVPKPDSQRYWRSSRVGSRMVAEGLNSITGGDKVKPGLIDVSPETIDLVVDTFGGSMARFWSDIASLPMSWVRGEETKLQQYPFIRRVAGQQSEYTNSQAYFKNVQDILTVRKQLETYRGTPYYDKLLKDTKDQQAMFGAVKGAEAILRRLRKRKRRAEASGNEQMVKDIEKRIDEIYIKFNKRYFNAGGKN